MALQNRITIRSLQSQSAQTERHTKEDKHAETKYLSSTLQFDYYLRNRVYNNVVYWLNLVVQLKFTIINV